MARRLLLAFLPLFAAAGAGVPDAPLFFVRADAVDANGGVVHYAFLPPNSDSSVHVWRPERETAWLRVVGNAVAHGDADVRSLGTDQPFPVRIRGAGDADDSVLKRLLPDGAHGFSAVRRRDGSVRTNALSVVRDPDTGAVQARCADPSVRALFPDRGAGAGLRFVSSQDLSNRWSHAEALSDAGRKAVREELAALRAACRDDPACLAWLDAWTDGDPDLWPGLRFVNATANGVEISFGGKTNRIEKGQTWTHRFTGRSELEWLKNWSYREEGTDEEDLVPPKPLADRWSSRAPDDPVVVRLESRAFKPGSPALDLRSLLPSGFATEPGKADPAVFKVRCRYADGELDEPVVLLQDLSGDPWKRVVAPRTEIVSFDVEETPWFEKAEGLIPDRTEYPHGNASVALRASPDGIVFEPAAFSFKPWGGLVLTNDCNRTVTNAVSFGDGSPWFREVLAVGERSPFPHVPLPGTAPNATSLVVRIESAAEFASGRTMDVDLRRGGADAVVAPRPELRELPWDRWPETRDRNKVGSRVETLKSGGDVQGALGGAADGADSVFKGELGKTVETIRDHLAGCRLPRCGSCTGFKEHLAAVGWTGPVRDGGDGADLEKKRVALACCREWMVSRHKPLEKLEGPAKMLGVALPDSAEAAP